MAPTSWLENVSAPRAPRYGVCVGGRNSLFMCKLCVPSQPLGSTTVINTSANVASGTAWQHMARRTARPHLVFSLDFHQIESVRYRNTLGACVGHFIISVAKYVTPKM